jgi:Hypoxia induced protein conserved region
VSGKAPPAAAYGLMVMPAVSSLFVSIAVAAVFVVLLLGLFNMLRGGSPNLSQTLMRWRVGLQFLAVVVIIGVLYFRK